jgi:hypothetical protein
MRYEEWKQRNGTMVCHAIYREEEAIAKKLEYKKNWRDGKKGDWVLTDDGFVVEILRGGQDRAGRRWIGTATMTTSTAKTCQLDTDKRENRYSFNGKGRQLPKNLTVELLGFCRAVAKGVDPVEAYLKYVAKDKNSTNKQYMWHIRNRVKSLMNHDIVRDKIDEEVKDLLEKAGIDKLWLVNKYKDIAIQGENYSAAKSAVDKLSDLAGLTPKAGDEPLQLPGVDAAKLDQYAPADAQIVPATPQPTTPPPEDKPEDESDEQKLFKDAI